MINLALPRPIPVEVPLEQPHLEFALSFFVWLILFCMVVFVPWKKLFTKCYRWIKGGYYDQTD
jgi:hypothetical protein